MMMSTMTTATITHHHHHHHEDAENDDENDDETPARSLASPYTNIGIGGQEWDGDSRRSSSEKAN